MGWQISLRNYSKKRDREKKTLNFTKLPLYTDLIWSHGILYIINIIILKSYLKNQKEMNLCHIPKNTIRTT